MCTYSMVYRDWNTPTSPNYIPWTPQSPDPVLAQQMLEVLKRLDAIDKRLGLVEQCAADAKEKRAFEAKLKRRAKRKSR